MIDDDPSPSSSQQEASRNEIFVPTSDSGLSRDNRRDESETPSSFALSVSFPETGLSPVYRGAYDKACRLSMSNSVVKAPGKHEGYLTDSESATAPNFVEVKRSTLCLPMSRISSVVRVFACASCGRHSGLFGGVSCVVPHEEWWSKFDGHCINYCTKELGDETRKEPASTTMQKEV